MRLRQAERHRRVRRSERVENVIWDELPSKHNLANVATLRKQRVPVVGLLNDVRKEFETHPKVVMRPQWHSVEL